MPSELQSLWQGLQDDLRSLNAGFDVWIGWYQDRLDGKPLDLELERKWALLPEEVQKQTPAEINAYLKRLREEHTPKPDDPDEALRDVPEEQEPGFQFAARADGKIDLKPSGLAPPDDLAEIAAMRDAITEALDDLVAVLEGSNAHSTISRVAQRYKSAIAADELSIDQLYSYGVRLENANTRFKAQIATGDCPDLAVPAGEALDSVLALHGPVIYSTKRGRELIERAREYARREADLEAYKAKARALAEAIQAAADAITEDARDAISQANDDIGEGPHPDRSTDTARAANQNILIAGAKAIAVAVGVSTVGSIFAEATIINAPQAWLAIETFFVANMPLLREFSAVAGFEIRWLPAFLNWLEAQRARRHTEG